MSIDKSRSVDRTDHYREVGYPEVIVGRGIRQGSAILSSVNHPPIILGRQEPERRFSSEAAREIEK
jgi:hypothetical protein